MPTLRDNSPNVPGLGRNQATPEERFEAFDALPKRIKDLLNYAPINLCPVMANKAVQRHLSYEDEFWATMASLIPRWRPLDCDPL